jgi:hypothetical protein
MKMNRRTKPAGTWTNLRNARGACCDPDLLSCAITLDNGAVVEERPND